MRSQQTATTLENGAVWLHNQEGSICTIHGTHRVGPTRDRESERQDAKEGVTRTRTQEKKEQEGGSTKRTPHEEEGLEDMKKTTKARRVTSDVLNMTGMGSRDVTTPEKPRQEKEKVKVRKDTATLYQRGQGKRARRLRENGDDRA